MLRHFERSVVVAVVAVRMVQMAIHEVIDMITVRNCLVPAAGAMDMGRGVAAAWLGASVRIFGADFDNVLIDVIRLHMLEMPVMQIIDVSVVFHGKTLVDF